MRRGGKKERRRGRRRRSEKGAAALSVLAGRFDRQSTARVIKG